MELTVARLELALSAQLKPFDSFSYSGLRHRMKLLSITADASMAAKAAALPTSGAQQAVLLELH